MAPGSARDKRLVAPGASAVAGRPPIGRPLAIASSNRPQRRAAGASAGWLIASLALVPIAAQAIDATVSFTVNSTVDRVDVNSADGQCRTSAGNCSLRAAIMQANHTATNGRVEINVPEGTYRLTLAPGGADGEDSGDLNLTPPIVSGQRTYIRGSNPTSTIIDGNQTDRVFAIGLGRLVTIESLSIRNGRHDLFNGLGGGVQNEGTLTLLDCVVENNHSPSSGGGVGNRDSGTLFVIDSVIRGNSTAFSGGGLYLAGTTSISYSSISGNVATGSGGGAFLGQGGTAFIRGSTIDANVANNGGGIHVDRDILNPGVNAQLTVVNSTLSGNFAYTNGGGINNESTTFLYNSSVVDNDADHDRDESGGIGGGVDTASGVRFVAVNNLIARNTILDAPIYNDCRGLLELYGRNLFFDVIGCTFGGNGNAARGSISPNSIGQLRDNGGTTRSHALLPGSEAINATTTQGCVDQAGVVLVVDQRDGVRGSGAACDIGAYEFGATPVVVDPLFRSGFEGGP